MDVKRNINRLGLLATVAPLAIGLALAAPMVTGTLVSPATARAMVPAQGFGDLVERVSPAVVQITAKKALPASAAVESGGGSSLPDDLRNGPFADFFERFSREGSPEAMPRGRQPHEGAIGSGFVIDESGLIVTNGHVVGGATEIRVSFKDGRSFPAELVGIDEKTDLAVLRVKADGRLPAVTWGDSQATRVGDWVLAVGNPFGLSGTVTAGIISARGRDIGAGPYDDFIQIDAPLNSGNSGGPLFNAGGDVIGVNTAIFSPNGGNVGIGFAIPAESAQKIVAELAAKGTVERGWLGVSVQPVTDDIAQSIGLAKPAGALITTVAAGSPAAEAGLRPGDVVLAFGDRPIEAVKDLSRAVAATPVGAKRTLKVWRGDREMVLTASVAAAETPVAKAERPTRDPERDQVRVAALGVDIAPADARTRSRFGLSGAEDGVVILRVDPKKDAARKDLRAGDVITQVNSRAVQTPADVVVAVEDAVKAARKAVLLRVERAGEPRFVALELTHA